MRHVTGARASSGRGQSHVAAALALMLALGGARPAYAADPDPWFGQDKALHFAATSVLGLSGYAVTATLTDRRELRVLGGVAVGLGAGIAKELLDLAGFGDPSWKDLAWDAIGTAVGVLVAWGIDLLLAAHRAPQPAPG